MAGYDVEPQRLRDGSGKIANAISAADNLELEKLAENKQSFGNDAVAETLNEFCSTWELATGLLQQRSASAGETLNSAADAYNSQERHAKSEFPQRTP